MVFKRLVLIALLSLIHSLTLPSVLGELALLAESQEALGALVWLALGVYVLMLHQVLGQGEPC